MIHPREVVTLHVGQAGIQMGNAVWETIVAEHSIDSDGNSKDSGDGLEAACTFFHQGPNKRYIPRCLMIDTEPSVIDEIRSGFYRRLFHPDFLLTGIEDASNNFARGYYTLGRKMLCQILEKIRYMIECCDNFKGFMSFSASSGGTGSGLYSLLLDRIMLEYTSKTLFGTLILAGQTLNDSIVDPYNSILRIGQSVSSDLNLLIDNESMYKICHDKLSILRPTYTNLNRLMSPILSSITAPIRFQGPLTTDLTEISTNLIPFPKINFPTLAYSPFITQEVYEHSSLCSKELIRDVFQQDHNLLGLNLQNGKLMSSVLTFRGLHQINTVIDHLNAMRSLNLYKWVDWCPTAFKITRSLYPGIHNFLGQPQNSVLMMCNHSEITTSLKKLCEKFSVLYSKRSFIHWFVGEGMEVEELIEAMDNVMFLRRDYEEVCSISKMETKESIDKKEEIKKVKNTSQPNQISRPETINNEGKGAVLFSKEQKQENTALNNSPESISRNSLQNKENLKRNSTPASSISTAEVYQMNPKAKEVLLSNVTSLSPDLKKRMFGNVE